MKTTYLLRYIHDEQLRHRVQLQLNRGEGRHFLARHLFWSQDEDLARVWPLAWKHVTPNGTFWFATPAAGPQQAEA